MLTLNFRLKVKLLRLTHDSCQINSRHTPLEFVFRGRTCSIAKYTGQSKQLNLTSVKQMAFLLFYCFHN